jgi:hypothetical protein
LSYRGVCIELTFLQLGNLSISNEEPYTALDEFESALIHWPDHPAAIVGLSNILLDIYTETLLPSPAVPTLATPTLATVIADSSQPRLRSAKTTDLPPTLRSHPLGMGSADPSSTPMHHTRSLKHRNTNGELNSAASSRLPPLTTPAATTLSNSNSTMTSSPATMNPSRQNTITSTNYPIATLPHPNPSSLQEQEDTTSLPPAYKSHSLPLVDRLAARDRAYALLSGVTRLGSAWNLPEAWFALARAHEESGRADRAKEVLWWCVELEEGRAVRDWREVGRARYVL